MDEIEAMVDDAGSVAAVSAVATGCRITAGSVGGSAIGSLAAPEDGSGGIAAAEDAPMEVVRRNATVDTCVKLWKSFDTLHPEIDAMLDAPVWKAMDDFITRKRSLKLDALMDASDDFVRNSMNVSNLCLYMIKKVQYEPVQLQNGTYMFFGVQRDGKQIFTPDQTDRDVPIYIPMQWKPFTLHRNAKAGYMWMEPHLMVMNFASTMLSGYPIIVQDCQEYEEDDIFVMHSMRNVQNFYQKMMKRAINVGVNPEEICEILVQETIQAVNNINARYFARIDADERFKHLAVEFQNALCAPMLMFTIQKAENMHAQRELARVAEARRREQMNMSAFKMSQLMEELPAADGNDQETLPISSTKKRARNPPHTAERIVTTVIPTGDPAAAAAVAAHITAGLGAGQTVAAMTGMQPVDPQFMGLAAVADTGGCMPPPSMSFSSRKGGPAPAGRSTLSRLFGRR